jgi:chaperonin GroES
VLVKVEGVDKQTKGGLFLTGDSTDKPTRGTVVAAGPGKPHPHTDVLITNPLVAGDKVIFGPYAGTKVKYCLDDHVMLSADEVLAKIAPDGAVVPLRDRAMLKPIEKPVETSAGIVLTKEASKAQEVPNQGEVIAVGEGRFTAAGKIDPVPLEVGDKVMYTKYGGAEVEYNGKKLVFVFAADCLAKYR